RRVPGRRGADDHLRVRNRRRAPPRGAGGGPERPRQRRAAEGWRGAGGSAPEVVPEERRIPGSGALDDPQRRVAAAPEVGGGQPPGRALNGPARSGKTTGRTARSAAPARFFCYHPRMRGRFALCLVAALLVPSTLRAEVTRVEIARRADLGLSGYEKIVGTIYFAVDPKDPRNRTIADLDKAPVNAAGRVEFSSDLYILRPKAPRGNGAALVDILNRGNKVALSGFNRGGSPDPQSDADLGDRFLMRFGYTLVWVGWEFDVPDRPMAMRIRVPVATDGGKPISGIVRARWTANARATEFVVNDLARYDATDPAGADSRLVACAELLATSCAEVPRAEWRVTGHTVTVDRGFEPGRTYEVAYRAANPPVAGLGF